MDYQRRTCFKERDSNQEFLFFQIQLIENFLRQFPVEDRQKAALLWIEQNAEEQRNLFFERKL